MPEFYSRSLLRVCPIDKHQTCLTGSDHIFVTVPLFVHLNQLLVNRDERLGEIDVNASTQNKLGDTHLLHPPLVRRRRVTIYREEVGETLPKLLIVNSFRGDVDENEAL